MTVSNAPRDDGAEQAAKEFIWILEGPNYDWQSLVKEKPFVLEEVASLTRLILEREAMAKIEVLKLIEREKWDCLRPGSHGHHKRTVEYIEEQEARLAEVRGGGK